MSNPSPTSLPPSATPHTGSLSRRMIGIAAAWISVLLLGGGVALDRILTDIVTRNFDDQLEYVLTAMIASAEIGPDGEVFFNRPLGDQRFLEPNSGLYWQVSGEGHENFASRSLWDRTLLVESASVTSSRAAKARSGERGARLYNSSQFENEPLRVIERSIFLPQSETRWHFVVAQSRTLLDEQIGTLRKTLINSFAILALGLIVLAALQTLYGLWPLRRVQRAIAGMRNGTQSRVSEPMPLEVTPMVDELNALIAHNEKQAEEARTHAGNLAHALKTPLTVVMNAATARADDLADTVIREAAVMRRQVDHHLARARAVGRRGTQFSRANIWESATAVERAVCRLYPQVRFDVDGDKAAEVAIERQDLDEILGNLIENAAKYGGGSVFVTIGAKNEDADPRQVEIWVEDDGTGIPEEARNRIFERGARLDTGKPGTGLGLAIVRDVAEIYGGSVRLQESEDLGGLHAILSLPKAATAG